jgi:hypothetical protein
MHAENGKWKLQIGSCASPPRMAGIGRVLLRIERQRPEVTSFGPIGGRMGEAWRRGSLACAWDSLRENRFLFDGIALLDLLFGICRAIICQKSRYTLNLLRSSANAPLVITYCQLERLHLLVD